MAPSVTVHFWNANDINDASPILEITDEDEFFRGFKITPDLYALGGWELTLARRVGFALFDSGAVQPEVFVRFLIHAWSDTEYYFGGLLQKRNQVVVARDEQGEEIFTFGGPGPKAYMDRYRLGIEQLTGTGWNLDLDNGVWNWTETATAGRVLNRVVAEDAAQADPSLPDLTKTFTDANDSSSTPWTNDVAGPNEYEIPIGESLLSVIFDLEDLSDLYTTINLGTVSAPLYRLEAWQTYGDDVTGTSPGVGVGLLREGLNIANDSLTVEGVGIRKCTHVIVEGKDGAWAVAVKPTWSSGEYIKWGKIEYTRSSNVTILERAGLRWLRRQDNGEKQITVEIAPGASEATGYYFPNPDGPLWLGNTVTLDTAEDGSTHTPLDFNNEDELLTGLDITLGPAGDTATADKEAKSWDVKVRLNWERAGFAKSPDQTSAATGNNPCKCPALCHPTVEGTPDSVEKYYSGGSDDPGGDAINWTGILQNQGSAGQGALGSDAYFFKSALPNEYQTSWAATAGDIYMVTGYVGCSSDGRLKLAFTTAAAGSSSSSVESGLISEEFLSPVQPGHEHAPIWTGFSAGPFTAPVGTNSAALGRSVGVDFDEVNIILVGTPGSNPYAGTDGRAARCDHVHPAEDIVFTPGGTIISENVQDAIEEVAEDAAAALADAIENLDTETGIGIHSHSDFIIGAVSNPPTQAEVETVLGSPGAVDKGVVYGLQDSGTEKRYLAISDGVQWHIIPIVVPAEAAGIAALTSAPSGGWAGTTHAAMYYNGVTYIAYVRGDNGNVELRTYTHSTQTVSAATVLHAALNDDLHSAPSLVVRQSDHRIHCFYSDHAGSQLYQWISTNPEDISAGTETNLDAQLGGTGYTYPMVADLESGIYLFVRYSGGAAAGQDWGYAVTVDDGTTWTALVKFYEVPTKTGYPLVNKTGDDRVDVIAIDGSTLESDDSIQHFYFEGGVDTFYATDGTELTLPVGVQPEIVVWDGTTLDDAYGRFDVQLGLDGRPRLLFATINGTTETYRHARWTGTAWVFAALLSGTAVDGDSAQFDSLDTNILYLSDASHEIRRLTTLDEVTWSSETLTTATTSIYPLSPVDHAPDLPALWLAGSFTSSSVYSLGITGYGASSAAASADYLQRIVVLDDTTLKEIVIQKNASGDWQVSFDGTSWEALGGGGATSLEDLTDVDITAAAEGDMLRFDGSLWVNTPGRWEPVTDGVDTFVWDGDEIVMAWKDV